MSARTETRQETIDYIYAVKSGRVERMANMGAIRTDIFRNFGIADYAYYMHTPKHVIKKLSNTDKAVDLKGLLIEQMSEARKIAVLGRWS